MTLRKAMIGAGVLVSVSEGGKDDMISEIMAISEQLMAARRSHRTQLIRELADITHFHSGFTTGMTKAQFEGPALDNIRAAVALLVLRAPDDAAAYRQFLLLLAQSAAEAHKEGTFLGIGGSRVSQAELVAIGKVREALGLD